MSQRHRSESVVLPPKVETRAHARGERHRVNAEMHSLEHQVFAGVEPDDALEMGNQWKPVHHHDSEKAREQAGKSRPRHWKMKMWKRRTAARKAKAAAYTSVLKQA